MRRRYLGWKTDNDNVHDKPELALPLTESSNKSWSRSSGCCSSPFRTQRSRHLVVIASVLLLIVLVVVVVAVVGYGQTTLRLWRYTKENDPFYKVLRFGNVSAVAALYRDLNYYTGPTRTTAGGNDDDDQSRILLPVVFYNLYIPPPPQSRQDAAFDIVREQLKQMQTIAAQYSSTTHGGHEEDFLVVHLITISSDQAAAEKAMVICNSLTGLQCHPLIHAEAADEMLALDGLYEYCLAHPTATVTYLHSKGSFHPNQVNDAWRRALTAAALHTDCWGHMNTCNVCGLQFFTQFTLFWPGNMWTAACPYVTQLIPPHSFASQYEAAVADLLLLRLDGVLQSLLLRDRPDYFGLDRYAAEHWIGSHPDLRPCDMDAVSERPQDIFKRHAPVDQVDQAFQFGLAPRHVGFAVGHNFEAHQRLRNSEEDRKKEIYLLPGRIYLWHKLYKRAPPATSWTWKWFPDGSFWQDRVDALGPGAIEDGALASMFHSLNSSDEKIEQLDWNSGQDVIYYFVRIRDRVGVEQAMDHMKILRQDTGHEWTVVLTVFNVSDHYDEFSSFCGSLWTDCRAQEATDPAVAVWAATTRLTRFCEQQPNHSVVFQIGEYPCRATDQYTHRSIVRSRLHDDPSNITCSKQDCTRGFTAQCSYVSQLIEPTSFLRGVEAAVKIVLLVNVRNERRWTQQPPAPTTSDTTTTMAVEQVLLYTWIAIHPTALPCDDVCNDLLSSSVNTKVSDRDRNLMLAILLVVEVYYKNLDHSDAKVLLCAQQWKRSLQLQSSVSQYLNVSTDESANRIFRAMEAG
jgi:hypothetical protein